MGVRIYDSKFGEVEGSCKETNMEVFKIGVRKPPRRERGSRIMNIKRGIGARFDAMSHWFRIYADYKLPLQLSKQMVNFPENAKGRSREWSGGGKSRSAQKTPVARTKRKSMSKPATIS